MDLPLEPSLIKARAETCFLMNTVQDPGGSSTGPSSRAPPAKKTNCEFYHPWCLLPGSQVGFPGPRSSQDCTSDLQKHRRRKRRGRAERKSAPWWFLSGGDRAFVGLSPCWTWGGSTPSLSIAHRQAQKLLTRHKTINSLFSQAYLT